MNGLMKLIVEDVYHGHFYVNPPCPYLCMIYDYLWGTNCWLSGWRVDRDTRTFIPRQHRQLLSLLEDRRCQEKLSSALTAKDPSLGDHFSMDQSEICAGDGSKQVFNFFLYITLYPSAWLHVVLFNIHCPNYMVFGFTSIYKISKI